MTTPGSMFSRKRPDQVAPATTTSLIAHGTRITGDVKFEGSLFLEGQIDGQVMASEPGALLTIGGQGLVQGDIHVPAAIVHGSVRGNVHAVERLELAATACVEGNVCYRSIVVVAGAQIHGRLQHCEADSDQGTAWPTAPVDATAVALPQITAGARKGGRQHTGKHKA